MTSEQPRHPSPVSFQPLRPATPLLRVLLWIGGPVLWVLLLLVVAEVVREREAVGIGLGVLAVSFVTSSIWLLVARRRAEREGRTPPECG